MRTWILFFAALLLAGVALFPGFASPAGPLDDLAGLFLGGGPFTVFLVAASLAAYAIACVRKSRNALLVTFVIALIYLLILASFNLAMPPKAEFSQTWRLDPGPRALVDETYLRPGGHGLGYRAGFMEGSGHLSAYHYRVLKVNWPRWSLWISSDLGLLVLLVWSFRRISRRLPAASLHAFEVIIARDDKSSNQLPAASSIVPPPPIKSLKSPN